MDLEKERVHSERALFDKNFDFIAKYMAVWHLYSLAKEKPEILNSETISILKNFLLAETISRQTQAYFMYKAVAKTLCSIITHSDYLADPAFSALKGLLNTTNGHPHRATAEALGTLPVTIKGPTVNPTTGKNIPHISWHQLTDKVGALNINASKQIGRSVVFPIKSKKKLMILKMMRPSETCETLSLEPQWMNFLRNKTFDFPVRFDIPIEVQFDGTHIFKLKEFPFNLHSPSVIHPKKYVIGFIADQDYYIYPTAEYEGKRINGEDFKEIIFRNAWLLGRLASFGIIHSAPIPLFHNRIQQQRRRDNGRYEWPRAGRLDRWFESCTYPNLGLTGIRDFEHFIGINGYDKGLYRYIGVHFLSLLLLTGSYFRSKDITRMGLDAQGKPVDVRDLFDQKLFGDLVYGIFHYYYHGFTADHFKEDLPFSIHDLTALLINEMGVDRYMDEILRIADQNEMTDDEFKEFLRNNGVTKNIKTTPKKGVKDIIIQSGPHLGEFNHGISIPELIEAVESMSSLCIAGKYLKEHSNFKNLSSTQAFKHKDTFPTQVK